MNSLGAIIGDNLKRLRGDLSQGEFAESIEVGLRTYQRYESGERILPDEAIAAITKKLNVPIGDLLRTHDEPGPKALPVSKTLQKLASIPDEVYDKALMIGIDNKEVWDQVLAVIDEAIEEAEAEKKSKKA